MSDHSKLIGILQHQNCYLFPLKLDQTLKTYIFFIYLGILESEKYKNTSCPSKKPILGVKK